MSKLLDEIIANRKAKALEYEAYLAQVAELARRVEAGQADDTPERLNTPGLRALYNNLGRDEHLALQVHETVMRVRPDDWRGTDTREKVIKRAMLDILHHEAEVERLFLIIEKQREY